MEDEKVFNTKNHLLARKLKLKDLFCAHRRKSNLVTNPK